LFHGLYPPIVYVLRFALLYARTMPTNRLGLNISQVHDMQGINKDIRISQTGG